jgi:hypothetical protein
MGKMIRVQITLEYTCERILDRQLAILKRELLAGREKIDNTFSTDTNSFVLLCEQKFTKKRPFEETTKPNGKVIQTVKSSI